MVKSGQLPPMFSRNHIAPFIDMLQDWSVGSLKEECLVNFQYKTGKRAGERFVVAERFMKSLKEYGFPNYPEYSADGLKIYQPSSSWKVLLH